MKASSKNKQSISLKQFLSRPEITMTFVLIIFCLALTLASDVFATPQNILNILRQIAVYAILGIGEAYIIITGGIDLSVGSLVGWSACVGGVVAEWGWSPGMVLIAMLVAGIIPGIINGILVAWVGLPPFIATLGMLNIAYGGALMITKGFPIRYRGTWLHQFGGGYIGIVPISVIVTIVLVIIGYVIAEHTIFGRNIYALGNSEKAAKLSGIKTDYVKIMTYAITGLLAGVCAVIQVGLLGTADASLGQGAELDVIAAVVIGGISMSGGEGNIFGVLVGAMIMGVLRNAFVLLAVSGYAQIVALGVVVVIAVAVDSLRRKKATV
ncbi:hypothetical protein B5E77_02735 [Lachnoclostridium sp. An131]|uniref:ABC transporter permease n=1 Tax=Lachnoclostridium sp. An131 TaxID=1965555 RepID=UPI000B369228|nr:ABC transporter permease [Lachnoclostridium sp. An131]OUQ28685.1 hypothetical protein B5E77_02735 [Lachnoclostridium sp. An131]